LAGITIASEAFAGWRASGMGGVVVHPATARQSAGMQVVRVLPYMGILVGRCAGRILRNEAFVGVPRAFLG
jgi:hypothetical protein